MTQRQPDTEDRIRSAVTALITVFDNLGPEHQALRAERGETTARERRGTVIRMGESIADAARTVSVTIGVLAKAYGLRDLSNGRQFAKDAEGGDYALLPGLPSSTDELGNAVSYLGETVAILCKAYAPTKKHARLAVARHPQHMEAALAGLREALTAVCAAVADDHADAEVEDPGPLLRLLTELENRVCHTVPAQGSGPAPEEVAAAIRADPRAARAAAVALAALADGA